MKEIALISAENPAFHFVVPDGSSRIGRSVEADFILGDNRVSRIHAVLERRGDSIHLSDLGSRNGTFVNDRRLNVQKSIALGHGDRVMFGADSQAYLVAMERKVFIVVGGPRADPAPDTVPISVAYDVELSSSAAGASAPGTPTEAPSDSFGFDPGTIEFIEWGIGHRTATQLLSKYRPVKLIKAGGMGRIFLVQERLSGRFVALKVMIERMQSSPPHVQQFVREAVITARLNHAHIIPVYAMGFIKDNQLYYTMRYVEGEPLRRVIDLAAAQRLTIESIGLEAMRQSVGESVGVATTEDVLRALRSAAMAVDYAHSLNLWHRDLKPDNILVSRGGETFVIDWGLVSVVPGRAYKLDLPQIVVELQSFKYDDQLLSETQDAISSLALGPDEIVGTPAYMAPEQCDNLATAMGIGSDVWAFGIMLFEALTGQHPIADHKLLRPRQIIERIRQDKLPEPVHIRPDVPGLLNDLCVKMLRYHCSDRMDNLRSFIDGISEFLK